jgi:hypothetical protein
MSSDVAEAVAAMILERSRVSAEAARRRRESKAAFKAERKAARTAGLMARHAAKLSRRRQPEMLF